MKLLAVLLLSLPLLAAGCCQRVTCTLLPASDYNNTNGGA